MKKLFLLTVLTFSLLALSCSKKENIPSQQANDVDLDLTKMSATMIYSNVFNMMLDPDSFENKTIRVSGYFVKAKGPHNEESYSVIVPDATQCCQQGLGFKYDFKTLPNENDTITVTGKFIIEELESGILYTYLNANDVKNL